MKPKIKKIQSMWELHCKVHRRSFDTFGMSAEQREKFSHYTVVCPSWKETIHELKTLYKERLIIR